MKRNVITRFLAIFLSVLLTSSVQVREVCAKEYNVPVSSETGDIEINLGEPIVKVPKEKIFDENTILTDNEIEIQPYMEAEIQLADAQEDSEVTSDIYYGSISGYLSQTNEYRLYPVTLSAGDYFQATLKLPTDSQIDYDLLLFDSSISLIKSSDYVTCTTGNGTLDESVGYLATADEKLYVCVYSVAGGSQTEAYTLDYSVTTNFYDSSEPDENAKEATALQLGTAGVSVSRKLNSPIDNDWYSFTVMDSPTYDKIRLAISSSSATNGCNIEIYRNLVSNYYGMQFIGSGNGGEIELPAGTYFLRVVSTNTFTDFNAGDIPTYTLSVVPVSKVDEVTITSYWSNMGNSNITYSEGTFYRVDENYTNKIFIKGRAYYTDENGVRQPAANAKIDGKVVDQQWENLNRPDMSTVTSTTTTDSNGYYEIMFTLKMAVGGLSERVIVSTHYYDLMYVTINSANNDTIKAIGKFYYLKYSDYSGT